MTGAFSKVLFLAIAIAMSSGTLGCKKLLTKKDAGTTSSSSGGTASSSSGNTPQDDADEQLLVKLDAYIDCLNAMSGPIHQSRSRYLSWVDAKTGPTGKERFVLGVLDLPKNSAQECSAGLEKARALPPADPKLQAAGDDYAKAVMNLDQLIDDAFAYYDNKNFKDDKFAKGKLLHPQLMAAFSAFSKADTGLHSTVDGITKPLSQRTLGRIEREDGKKFRWHRKNTLIAARELIEAGDPVGDDDDIDFALFSAAFNEFDKAINDLEAYGTLHKKDLDLQSNPAWPLAGSHYDSFVRSVNDFRKKAREWNRCLRDAPAAAKNKTTNKIDPLKMPPCPEGRQRDVVAKYNEFIRTSNSNQFP
ncbi:MAG: YiiG family protein [Deltaproteobacteria bacterium]|nr:YiiG family protein [Deltaproteobacteria bacterium]